MPKLRAESRRQSKEPALSAAEGSRGFFRDVGWAGARRLELVSQMVLWEGTTSVVPREPINMGFSPVDTISDFRVPHSKFRVLCVGFTNGIHVPGYLGAPVQTMPPWEKTAVPGQVGLTHFHSSTISGPASCMISRTLASTFPRQSPSSLILASMIAEAESTQPDFLHVQLQSSHLI